MLNFQLFQGLEYPLKMYNRQPILEIGFAFFYKNCEEGTGIETDVEFDFPNYVSAYFIIYNERLGRTIKTYLPIRTGNVLNILSQDTTFDQNGKYYYEVGYVQSGGYEQVLRYGSLTVV